MCGICGYIDHKGNADLAVLESMSATLRHRGPDDLGNEVFTTEHASVGLGHTRLAVLDVSKAGHQPMHYGQLSIVLNGEIYNFMEIRDELMALGHRFVTRSDTEVILHAFAQWGDECVSRFIGMFAFALYDREQESLTFVRDRAGVKPFFYYRKDHLFLFASELKAFHRHPGFRKEVDERSAKLFMDFGYVPAPHTIFRDCYKLEPGHMLTYHLGKGEITGTRYWDVMEHYRKPALEIPYPEALERLEDIFRSAFSYRMVSDVPVGVFLSGGMDSTAVTALLQEGRTEKLRTFTIGFEEGNNEAPEAREISRVLGTDHTEYICTSREAQEIIPTLPDFYDEPFADASAIPTILVSQLARKAVTVALSADAGDELFAGYVDHATFMNSMARLDRVPPGLRPLAGGLAGGVAGLLPKGNLKRKVTVLSKVLRSPEERIPQVLLRNFLEMGTRERRQLMHTGENHLPTIFEEDLGKIRDRLSMALAIDYRMYLQNDILTKVDRATMSVALEGREPLLDHRILEFAARLPSDYKYGEIQKRILKDTVYRYVPQELMDRPKAGFSVPVFSWLRGDLSYLLDEFLEMNRVREAGLFRDVHVHALKKAYLQGKKVNPLTLWKILQYQMWYWRWMR
jgi:asparagine synthase (glutamine-hydrolysing)